MKRVHLIEFVAGVWIGLFTRDLSLLTTLLVAAGVGVCIAVAWNEGRRQS